ncbi:TIGR02450 family Trp-rich protein [Candidatus Thioglobus sp.]|nr:TIGR02450 family Trp-rich protein [Candidatus Thioglobus sp.]MDB3893065.1 TIGR02450 family Trp-rich protein [Candidatus Thioglobus sp.]MDC0388590.1 TIGR02450 family Trp-rich protein [Candidatus Thioglobus sp.]MDC0889002.1 TIGR02450 family Trp-rich protein [Candidatus Thioglobus sp.]MDC0904011.1 TIGR02450 family Trp-rich protein [Candidatus Thioglobus sp.]
MINDNAKSSNRLNPEKLLLTKWTALNPKNKELHFIVTKLLRDDNDKIISCNLEAVINKNSYEIDWRDLKDSSIWKTDWN